MIEKKDFIKIIISKTNKELQKFAQSKMNFLRARVKYLTNEAHTLIQKVANQTSFKRSESEPAIDKSKRPEKTIEIPFTNSKLSLPHQIMDHKKVDSTITEFDDIKPGRKAFHIPSLTGEQ